MGGKTSGISILREAKTSEYEMPVEGKPALVLRPVKVFAPDPADVKHLTEWRNLHRRSFLTEFTATAERTRAWLTGPFAEDDSRILFMIGSANNAETIGCVGLACIDWASAYGELDNVVRGSKAHPGGMSRASEALFSWARQRLGLALFGVRVLADNPAVAFYERLGFTEVRRVALRRSSVEGGVAWKEVVDSDTATSDTRWLLYMALQE